MDEKTLEQIRKRAYELWETAGKPHGRDRDHWQQAESEILTPATQDKTPAAKPAAARKKPAAAKPTPAKTRKR